ncbi:Abi family protein [Magnetovibrio sp. PR-2]|uniref:Abi family protein n=1 Tax=Magnetovibrio sp. PR-2 TaxID=3120356 RepID=UPI002FCE501E
MPNSKTRIFTKPAFTPEQHLEKLRNQGLHIESDERAKTYLQHVGGYRLKGYWYHLLCPTDKTFPETISFDKIIDRYEFDRQLRALTFEAIEKLEIAVRGSIANTLSVRHGPHWFLNTDIFKPTKSWGIGTFLNKIEHEVARSKSKQFVESYYNKFDKPYLPPSWAMTECVTFGFWSRIYTILEESRDRKSISMKFGIDQTEVFESWLHYLTYVRNHIAHHNRLLRLKLTITPTNYKKMRIRVSDTKYFYSAATVINVMLINTGIPSTWKDDLEALFAKFPDITLSEIGFPNDWTNKAGW